MSRGFGGPEAAFGRAFDAVFGGEVEDLVFTALTDTRFYGLNTTFRACVSAPAARGCTASTNMSSSKLLRKTTKATALFIAEWWGVEKA